MSSGDTWPEPQLAAYRKACLEVLDELKASDEVVNTVSRIVTDLDEVTRTTGESPHEK